MHFYEKEILRIKQIYCGKKEVKKAEQHIKHYLKHGWWEEHSWAIDVSIASYAIPLVKALRKRALGYPPGLTPRKWDKILGEIIWSLEQVAYELETKEAKFIFRFWHKHCKCSLVKEGDIYRHVSKWDNPENRKKYNALDKAHAKKVQSGLDLFFKYFKYLWD